MAEQQQQEETTQYRRVPWMRFPGVWTCIAGALQASVGYGWYYYGWTIFIRHFMKKPEEGGLGYTGLMVGALTGIRRIIGIVAPVVGGWAVDNYGPRYTSMLFFLVMSASFALLAMFTEFWHLFIIYCLMMYFAGSGGLYRVSYTAANRWWMSRRATGIAAIALGGGSGGIIYLPFQAIWLLQYGFRTLAWIGSAMILAIAIPAAFLYPQLMPEAYGLYPDNVTPEMRREMAEREAAARGERVRVRPMLQDLTVAQTLRDKTFWILVASAAVAALSGGILTIFQNARMAEAGYSVVEAALFYSFNNVMTYVGRLSVMFFGDWFANVLPVRYTYVIIRIVLNIGLICFAIGANVYWFYAWALLYGTMFGASVPYYPVLMGAYFGRQAFGTIYGLRIAFGAAGGIVSPFFLGWLIDVSGWLLPFLVSAGVSILSALIILAAVPPKAQTRERVDRDAVG